MSLSFHPTPRGIAVRVNTPPRWRRATSGACALRTAIESAGFAASLLDGRPGRIVSRCFDDLRYALELELAAANPGLSPAPRRPALDERIGLAVDAVEVEVQRATDCNDPATAAALIRLQDCLVELGLGLDGPR